MTSLHYPATHENSKRFTASGDSVDIGYSEHKTLTLVLSLKLNMFHKLSDLTSKLIDLWVENPLNV